LGSLSSLPRQSVQGNIREYNKITTNSFSMEIAGEKICGRHGQAKERDLKALDFRIECPPL